MDQVKPIPDEHVLPCDFIVGSVTFRKGVKLETVRQAAERWLIKAAATWPEFTQEQIDAIKNIGR